MQHKAQLLSSVSHISRACGHTLDSAVAWDVLWDSAAAKRPIRGWEPSADTTQPITQCPHCSAWCLGGVLQDAESWARVGDGEGEGLLSSSWRLSMGLHRDREIPVRTTVRTGSVTPSAAEVDAMNVRSEC